MTWTFQYIQTEKSPSISQTLEPYLEGNVASATGIWSSYRNASVSISYNNINGQRDILIRVCS